MSNKRKSQAFTEAIVGVFMVAVILMLGYFTIIISGVDVLKGNRKTNVRIVFEQVGGLKDHDNVMYRGTKVGVVDEVNVTSSNLMVVASIDKDVVIRDGYSISVCNLSMLGGNYLLIEEGEGKQLDLATTIFTGATPSDWMKDVQVVAKNIRAFTEMSEIKGIVTNVANMSERGRSVSKKADEFMDKLDALMTQIKKMADRLDNDQTYKDFEAGVAAFRKAAESFDATETKAKANELMDNFDKRASELLDNLNVVARNLRTGEGTLGKLANDREMYDHINALIKDCRQVLDNYRDTTPISTFSSLATGAL